MVREGDQIESGTVVGLEGSTGYSTGPHLHFEIDQSCGTAACSIDPSNLISPPNRT
ncbi:MAG: M23 family metallopeptidase [Candidatus Dormibacteraeota bacterium]|nr:M23 family metallopeptidase [Candidatus Dormibacteraeota bacterium]